ncbi:MAG: hypothetical protein Tsb0020_00580 [Haliangiales bacterium]
MDSFLSRLSRRQRESSLASVIRNLNHLFNAQRGYGSEVRDFGLGDYNAFIGGDDMSLALIRELTALIERYEPRVQRPSVELVGRDPKSWVRFRLAGEIDGQRRHLHIDLDTRYREVVVSLASSRADGGERAPLALDTLGEPEQE